MARKIHLTLTGYTGDVIDFTEIKDVVEYLEGKDWKLTLKKIEDKGWRIEWIKEVQERE